MAGFPFHLYGGATRPDAISGLNPAFSQALLQLYNAAPLNVQAELGLTSAYRSPQVQQELWNKSDKTGRTVAAPGKSKHQSGTAADLYGFGLNDQGNVSQATKDWVKANARAQGLYFPMGYEPWHIQLANGGTAPGPNDSGGIANTMASAVDPRAAVLAQMENNPFKSITDVAPKRGGLVGEGSAGGGLSAPPAADPAIPALETAAATLTPDALLAQRSVNSPVAQLGQLAELFRTKTIGQPPLGGQALPMRRSI